MGPTWRARAHRVGDRGGGAHRAGHALGASPSAWSAATTSTFEIDRRGRPATASTSGDVQEVIQTAVGGMTITETVEGLERYPVNVRYDRDFRDDLEALRTGAGAGAGGRADPAGAAGRDRPSAAAPMVDQERERASRTPGSMWTSRASTSAPTSRRRAAGGGATGVKLPPGYNIVWSGQYEYMERAQAAPAGHHPAHRADHLRDHLHQHPVARSRRRSSFSPCRSRWSARSGSSTCSATTCVAVWVGMIALAGLDAETGVVMLLYLDLAHEQWRKDGRMRTCSDLGRPSITAR